MLKCAKEGHSMKNKFSCPDSAIRKISEEFPLNEKNIVKISKLYEKLIDEIPYQYLAHIIRTIEEYIRTHIKGADFFRITCKPIKNNEKIKGLASATYQKFYSFDIVYDDSGDNDESEINKRVWIAHELGHLLVSVMLDQHYNLKPHEPLSSVYGILITLHKKFCKNTERTSISDDEIINDFKKILAMHK